MTPLNANPKNILYKQWVTIFTVDTANRVIEAMLRDGALIRISVIEIPTAFVWPRVGEQWSVRYENNIWRLESRIHGNEDPNNPTLEDLAPGELRLDSDSIKTRSHYPIVSFQATANQATLHGPYTLPFTVNTNGTAEQTITHNLDTSTPIVIGSIQNTEITVQGTEYITWSWRAANANKLVIRVRNGFTTATTFSVQILLAVVN